MPRSPDQRRSCCEGFAVWFPRVMYVFLFCTYNTCIDHTDSGVIIYDIAGRYIFQDGSVESELVE